MTHMQLSRTKVVPEAWRELSDAENDAQTAALYDVIAQHGGDVKVVAFSPSDGTILSVIEFPDLAAAQAEVAGILALGTLEYESINELWDIGEWVQVVRKAAVG
jgi:hypothetical protein